MTREEAMRTGLPLSIGAAAGVSDERERPDAITAGPKDQTQEREPPARALLPEEQPILPDEAEDDIVDGGTTSPAETLAFDGFMPTPAQGVLDQLDRLIAKAIAKKYGSANTIHAKLGLLESLL